LTSLGCPHDRVPNAIEQTDSFAYLHRHLPFGWTISNWCWCLYLRGLCIVVTKATQRMATQRNYEKGKYFGDKSECSLVDLILDLLNTTRNVISLGLGLFSFIRFFCSFFLRSPSEVCRILFRTHFCNTIQNISHPTVMSGNMFFAYFPFLSSLPNNFTLTPINFEVLYIFVVNTDNKIANGYRKSSYLYFVHGKNGFAEVSKNLARFRSKNNFVELLK